jgi:FSR family fosmidomycin resistance protein-like MFS transporter
MEWLEKLKNNKNQRVLLALVAGHFINDSYSGFLAPLLPLLMERLDFSFAVAGMLASVFTFSTSFLQPLYGWLNDLLGKRAFVYLGPFVTAFFLSLAGFAPSVAMLAIILLLSGSGTASYHPAGSAAVARVSSNRAGWSMSLFITAGNFGHSLGPIIVVPIVMILGFEFLPLTVLPAVLIFFVLFKLAPASEKRPMAIRKPVLRDLLNTKSLSLVLHQFMAIARAATITAFGIFLPLLLKERGMTLFWGSLSLTLFIGLGSVGALLGGYLSDRINRKRLLVFSFAGALPFLSLFLYTPAAWGIAFLLIGGMILYLTLPLNVVMAQEIFPGRAGTMAAMMIGVGWGTGGLLMTPLGFLAEAYSLTFALKCILAILGIGILASLLLPVKKYAPVILEPAENVA